jgi:hypothetical protein
MRKKIVALSHAKASGSKQTALADGEWLNMPEIATVEVTSEDARFPIEAVFASDAGPGWRASKPGKQLIRVLFDKPISLRRIQLEFQEPQVERTQEFTLRWFTAAGASGEIVRQQWNFSPTGSTREIEEYTVSVDGVSVLELALQPNISDHHANESYATLAAWRVGTAS